jgi:hypothetical protein
MPFLRYDRDRRGNLSTFLVHTFREGRKPRSLVLYWFRSPPHVRVGRLAIDDDTIRTIEELHPDLVFDWPKLLSQRPPPLEMQKWTSKRRQQKVPKGDPVRRRRLRVEKHVEEVLSPAGDLLQPQVDLMDSPDEGTDPGQIPEGVSESTEMSSPAESVETPVVAVEGDQKEPNGSNASQGESESDMAIDRVDSPPMTRTDPDG